MKTPFTQNSGHPQTFIFHTFEQKNKNSFKYISLWRSFCLRHFHPSSSPHPPHMKVSLYSWKFCSFVHTFDLLRFYCEQACFFCSQDCSPPIPSGLPQTAAQPPLQGGTKGSTHPLKPHPPPIRVRLRAPIPMTTPPYPSISQGKLLRGAWVSCAALSSSTSPPPPASSP